MNDQYETETWHLRKHVAELDAENQRLRKAVERQDRLRQKLKALRKEVRRLNRWREIFAAGQRASELAIVLMEIRKMRNEVQTDYVWETPNYRAAMAEIAGRSAPLDGGNGAP